MDSCQEINKGPSAACQYVVKCPKALQWFDNGRLIKILEGERQASRFELFLDLLYVALVANFSEDFAEHATGISLVKYILIFVPAWHIWSDLREIMNSYYTDDLIQRVVILWVMALLVLYGNNAVGVGEDIGKLRTTVGAYMAARFSTALAFAVCSFASYQHRAQARLMAAAMGVGLLLCVPLFFEGVSLKAKIAVTVVIIVWQEVTWAGVLSPVLKKRLGLRYSTAVDIAHEIDRLAAFYIITLGEFVYVIVFQSPTGTGLTPGYANAVCTLIIAFCLNWLYTSGDGSIINQHPIRRAAFTAFLWFLLHIPLTAALLAGGHVAAITAKHAYGFEQPGQPWILGGGLGVGMFCLWFLAILHLEEAHSPKTLMPKMLRVAMRPVVGVILVLLPLANWQIEQVAGEATASAAHKIRATEPAAATVEGTAEEGHGGLPITNMMAIAMALIAFTVIWETVGGLLKGARLLEPWEFRHPPEEQMLVNGDDDGLVQRA